jgi:hypothetical protein
LLHYHGGPIWPETSAAKVLKNRHAMVSFARPEQTGCVAEVSSTFVLDNGAFSFWKSGTSPDWDKYYLWVEKWHRHPGFDWAVIPDVIDGEVSANKSLIEAWPLPKHVGVPVWHLHEPLHWLFALCLEYPRVAIGSSGDYATIGTPKWWNRMSEAFNKITDSDGRPIAKIHGLRMLDPRVFSSFPFASCDSTNVAQNCKDSSRWRVYNPPNNETRGIVLAERIEATTSKSTWSKIPTQISLY